MFGFEVLWPGYLLIHVVGPEPESYPVSGNRQSKAKIKSSAKKGKNTYKDPPIGEGFPPKKIKATMNEEGAGWGGRGKKKKPH